MNQIISCLAGGRNKMMASRAYDFYNSEIVDTGLSIKTPETINNVTLGEVPLWIRSMGGHAVLKVPYSNAGQGVYTITNKNELNDFLILWMQTNSLCHAIAVGLILLHWTLY
jgi:hypothetical protein